VAVLNEYRVGYAPQSGVEFCDLLQKHYSDELYRECGLLSSKADGTYLSKVRDRLMSGTDEAH
jgi:DNA primase